MNNKEPSKPLVLEFCKIDGSFDVGDLLREIKEILIEGDSHNATPFSRETWSWQYEKLPGRDARIYVCLYENKIVGYYHVPIYEGVIEGESKIFAMVQDVAVSAKMRGQNVFRRLADFATNDLANSNINLIYTFPNEKSIRTFLKYGDYKLVSTFDSFVLPVKTAGVLKSKFQFLGVEKLLGALSDKYFDLRDGKLPDGYKVSSIQDFDEETTKLFQTYNAGFYCHLNRTQDYLRWRFLEKPTGKHLLLTLRNNAQTLVAAAVFKLDEILKARTAVVLDFAFAEEKHFLQLLYFVRANAASLLGEKVDMLFVSCRPELLSNSAHKFIKIPLRLNPRPLNLLVKNLTESERVLDNRNWLATLSDWDVL